MVLLGTVANEEPANMRETARIVERDVKNIHDQLTRLERLGIIRFEQLGRSKRSDISNDPVPRTLVE